MFEERKKPIRFTGRVAPLDDAFYLRCSNNVGSARQLSSILKREIELGCWHLDELEEHVFETEGLSIGSVFAEYARRHNAHHSDLDVTPFLSDQPR